MFKSLFRIKGNNEVKVNKELDEILKAKNLSNEIKFKNLMNFAIEILDNDKITKGSDHPIFDFIRILGRGLQSDYMKYVFYYNCYGGEQHVPALSSSVIGLDQRTRVIGEEDEIISLYKLKKEIISDKKINLSTDLIIPSPWNKDRLVNAINRIGNRRQWGKWKQDYNNHFVELWLPIGIAWVNNGNHSITMGILQGEELKPKHYFDISEMYKYIKCDGKNFIRMKTNFIIEDQIIAPVSNVDFAAIFEIGRLLLERGISFIK